MSQDVLSELARVKVLFQQRALIAAMGVHRDSLHCKACGAVLCDCPDPVYQGVLPSPTTPDSGSL